MGLMVPVWTGRAGRVVHATLETPRGADTWSCVGLTARASAEVRATVRAALRTATEAPPAGVALTLEESLDHRLSPQIELPLALGLLGALGEGDVAFGLLHMSGRITPPRGALGALQAAREAGARRAIVAPQDAGAAVAAGLEALPVESLAEAVGTLRGEVPTRPLFIPRGGPPGWEGDFEDVHGGPETVEAVEAACALVASGRGVLLVGPPGAGRTMIARRLVGLLGAPSPAEALEISVAQSGAGWSVGRLEDVRRPFRAPHHSCSADVVAGGRGLGEADLARHGVLFLDELPAFSELVVDEVAAARGFTLVASATPCPCGYEGTGVRACSCKPAEKLAYARRLSSFARRLRLNEVEVPAVRSGTEACPSTAALRARYFKEE